MLVYIDDCIIISQNKISIDMFIDSLKFVPEKFDFADEVSMDKYLGVDIKKTPRWYWVYNDPTFLDWKNLNGSSNLSYHDKWTDNYSSLSATVSPQKRLWKETWLKI